VIGLRKDKRFLLLILALCLLLPSIISVQVNAPFSAFSDGVWVEEKHSAARETAYAGSSGSVEVDQGVAGSFQDNSIKTILGGGQALQLSPASNSASFSRHIMCKDFDIPAFNPINPTTIFRPSDTRAVCLTTVSINNTIEFRWYYRSNSSRSWVSCYNWSRSFSPGARHVASWFLIAGYWPAYNYPRAYKVEVYLDDSPSSDFSEFFEVTNGGLNSPRMCKDVDANGHPINMTSRFTNGSDTVAHHYLRFDKIAYFNEESGHGHNFTTVWIKPNGSTYKTYSGNFPDCKDIDVTWNYWEYKYTPDDYITINSSTPAGNWKVEVYLDSHYSDDTWMSYGPVATTPFIVGNETVADWTFMVYLDADNNLERAGIEIFNKTASVDPSPRVNIVVQMDRNPGHNSTLGYDDRYGNWTDCKRFNVTKGMTPASENAVMNLTEVNMGHPDTLKDFVNWTISNYPASYYFLVLWDHGIGCMGVCFDFFNETGPLPYPDALSLPEIGQALSGLPAVMDVVLFDACSMGMIEVAYQIEDYANVLVAPEGLGWAPAPYDDYLSSLAGNSSMLPSVFARDVVTEYMEWCNDDARIQNATMSAADLAQITGLTAAIDDFAIKLKANEILYHEQISLARSLTEGYKGPYGDQSGYYIDLYHFAEQIHSSVLDDARMRDEEIRNAADQLMTTLESIIIIEEDKERPNSHGLSIFFPDEKAKYDEYKDLYEETRFAEDTLWDEFVIYHLDLELSGYVLTIQTLYSGITIEFDDESYKTDGAGKLRAFVLPDSYSVTVPTPLYDVAGSGSRGIFLRWDDDVETPSRTITVSGPATFAAQYETQYEVTFSQSGVGIDFPETILTIEGDEYNITTLPVSFWWADGSPYDFAFQSPLEVAPNATRYIWNSSIGLSSLQGGSLTVSASGNVIGNYKTQFHLALATSPLGVTTPSGEGWYYNGTDAPISADEFVDITPEASRHRFNGWTTTNLTEISDADSPSTSVRMDEAKLVTANYVTQYYFNVKSPYGSPSPTSRWFDSETSITASVTSPWSSGAADTRYSCNGWTGTGSVSSSGTAASVTFTIDAPSSITWNWKTQHLLTVRIDPTGISPLPDASPPGPWYDNGTLVNCTAQKIAGRVFDYWTVDGARWDPGVGTITVTMDKPYEATAHYVREQPWWEILFSLESLSFILGIVLPVALLGVAWIRSRRRRAVTKVLLNKIDDIYSKFKLTPPKCEEELHRLRNAISKDLADGKITQECYDLVDKKIEEHLEELRKR
jgi:hypothetical protein